MAEGDGYECCHDDDDQSAMHSNPKGSYTRAFSMSISKGMMLQYLFLSFGVTIARTFHFAFILCKTMILLAVFLPFSSRDNVSRMVLRSALAAEALLSLYFLPSEVSSDASAGLCKGKVQRMHLLSFPIFRNVIS